MILALLIAFAMTVGLIAVANHCMLVYARTRDSLYLILTISASISALGGIGVVLSIGNLLWSQK